MFHDIISTAMSRLFHKQYNARIYFDMSVFDTVSQRNAIQGTTARKRDIELSFFEDATGIDQHSIIGLSL